MANSNQPSKSYTFSKQPRLYRFRKYILILFYSTAISNPTKCTCHFTSLTPINTCRCVKFFVGLWTESAPSQSPMSCTAMIPVHLKKHSEPLYDKCVWEPSRVKSACVESATAPLSDAQASSPELKTTPTFICHLPHQTTLLQTKMKKTDQQNKNNITNKYNLQCLEERQTKMETKS